MAKAELSPRLLSLSLSLLISDVLGFFDVLEGSKPGLLFEDGTIRGWGQGGVVVPARTALVLGSGSEDSGLRVWGPVLIRLGLDHIVRYDRRTFLIVHVLVVDGEVGTPPAIPNQPLTNFLIN